MPNLTDVARQAGVSIAAASLALNNPDTRRVSAVKRKTILALAQKLGYSPNGHAKALRKKMTKIVGLVVPMRDPVFFNDYIAEALSGIQSGCSERGYDLMIYSHKARTGKITRNELRQSRFADGLIFMHTRMCSKADIDATIAELLEVRSQFVMLNNHPSKDNVNSVGVDDREIGYRAATYLAERGHKKIAFLGGTKHSPSGPLLLKGFEGGLAEKGISPIPRLCRHGEFDRAITMAAVSDWLKRPPRPTAIFCAYDQLVPDVYEVIHSRGLVIPVDIAVLSRGDLPLASYLTPHLSSFHVPIFEMGRLATELLLNALGNGTCKMESPQQIILPCPLIERQST